MEHNQLRDKLESLDLSNVDGIQWNQEHTWSRLSEQLQLTKRNRDATWYYAIAASVVLLVVFMSGYVFIQKDEHLNKNQLAINNSDIKEQESASQVPTTTQPIIKNTELKSTKTMLDKPTVQEVNIKPDTKIIIPEDLDETVTLDTTHNIDINNNNVDLESMKEVIPTKDLISIVNLPIEAEVKYSETPSVLLTSIPINQKKNKLSIKLFQRKNKRKRNNATTIPALTLFASN